MACSNLFEQGSIRWYNLILTHGAVMCPHVTATDVYDRISRLKTWISEHMRSGEGTQPHDLTPYGQAGRAGKVMKRWSIRAVKSPTSMEPSGDAIGAISASSGQHMAVKLMNKWSIRLVRSETSTP